MELDVMMLELLPAEEGGLARCTLTCWGITCGAQGTCEDSCWNTDS
jgi:hypothetical protein